MARPEDTATEILPSRDAAPTGAATADGSPIGRTLGKFKVVERLGRGGSSEVFRAEQIQLGRSAVIKVLRREVANAPNRVERFLREAKLASRLDHPYAAHVYAFGAEPDGVLWIAMEHVQGVTLDELIAQRGSIPPAVFAPLFGRLCEVVHSAHEPGIVHRDIKGANVMAIERSGQLLPKLLDFGIAKGLDDTARRTTCLPSSGSLPATSTRARTSTRSACSRIAASPAACRSRPCRASTCRAHTSRRRRRIACRVPLRVTGSRLESAPVECSAR